MSGVEDAPKTEKYTVPIGKIFGGDKFFCLFGAAVLNFSFVSVIIIYVELYTWEKFSVYSDERRGIELEERKSGNRKQKEHIKDGDRAVCGAAALYCRNVLR